MAMSFLESLSKIAKPIVRPVKASTDPIVARRDKVNYAIDEQLALLKVGDTASRWFTKNEDGSYVVSLRNGNVFVPLGGNTHFSVPSASQATKFYETAKKAIQAGELDQALEESKLKRKPKTEKK